MQMSLQSRYVFLSHFRLPRTETNWCVNLLNSQGSTESTWYAWDFGDGSPVVNKTGLSNAEHVSHKYSKHGDFVVKLTAANKAGKTVVTAYIIIKGTCHLHLQSQQLMHIIALLE